METKTYFFQKSASTTLWCFTGYHFNDQKSRRCSGSTRLHNFSEKPCTGTPALIDFLESKACQQNWPRQYFWERGSGQGFRPRAGPRL